MRFCVALAMLVSVACNGSDDPKTGSGDTGAPTDTFDTGQPEPPAPDEFAVIECNRTLTAPPAGQTCAVIGDPDTANTVLLQGDVLGDPDVYAQGEIRFALGLDNATIECVGCDCDNGAPTVIVSCPDAVITPGLVNAHDHIRYAAETVKDNGDERYDHRHDWRTGARNHTEIDTSSSNAPEVTLYGELRMMLGGATSIAGSIASVNASGLMRNLDNDTYNEGLNPGEVDYSTFPLGDIRGTLEPERCSAYDFESSNALNNEIYLPHVAEGIDLEARNEFACLSGQRTQSVDYIQDNTSIVHGIGLTAQDIALAASRGAHLVWSPRSNLSLYGDTARVVTYDRFAVPIALGTDWIPSGSSTMLRELACADQFNRDHLGGYFSDFALWRMVTRNAALAMGVDDQLGRIDEGLIADLAIIGNDGSGLHGAVVSADIDDVALVLRGGRVLTGEEPIVAGLVPSPDVGSCEALAECVSDHVVCVDRAGFSLASIEAGVPSSAYPLYICSEPDDEPSCEPFRNDEDGDGVIYPTSSMMDADLDGVDDADDNCPSVFNPLRPLDVWMQADTDGDGDGDACDVCPLEEGTDCSVGDLDGDGVDDIDDNCPTEANPSQIDADDDGLGAACDECDDFPAPSGACGVSVYDVKQGMHTGELVVIEALVITGVADSGYFAQLDPASPTHGGAEFSGIYTFSPDTVASVAVGDVVRIEAGVQDFFGQLQLSNVVSVQSTGTAPVPTPVLATPDEVRTNGSRAAALEALLVTVEAVEVTAVELPAGPGDSNPSGEFEVDGSLRVNDLFFALSPAPEVGDDFDAITGILRFANDDSKLEPRAETDYAFGNTEVDAITPSFLPVEVGATETVTVSLRFPSGSDQAVQLSCLPSTSLACPPSVVVPAGLLEADFTVDGLQAGLVTVEATLNASSAIADVQVYDATTPRTVVDLAPAALSLQPSASGTLTVTLDLPAPAGGLVLPITADPGITVPATVTVLDGDVRADLTVTAGATLGSYSVTVDGVTSTVDVANAPAGQGIAFWEYTEPTTGGAGGNNKVLELKNLQGTPF
ncbi:MAG: amidohydrolase family protein, partial [Myxococcota bacterium]